MIIDSSALVAILRREEDADLYSIALAESTENAVSAATLVETGIVLVRAQSPEFEAQLDELLADNDVERVAFTAHHANIALQAHRMFGRGSGHSARLNFGDCMAYALARATGRPLLFKGNDFTKTDIRAALETS